MKFRHRVMYATARLTAFLPRRAQIALSGEPPVIVDGQQLDPQVQLLRALRRKRRQYGLVEPSVEAGRARYRRESKIFNPRPTRVGSVLDFEIGSLRVRHYRPDRTDGGPLTVYFHGGGFVIGDLDTHDEPCRMLCRYAGCHIQSIGYRLAPEHPYPAAVKDALAAFRWARANAASLGADPRRVAVGGDSAGANLAAVVALGESPCAQLLIYPPADGKTDRPSHHLFDKGFTLSMDDHHAFHSHYFGGGSVPEPPSLMETAFASSRAPALVAVAGFDILRDEVEAYAGKLADGGTLTRVLRFPGLGHGFVHMTTVCTTARRAVVSIAEEWRAMLAAQ
jgi:acetyl esterase